MENDDLGLYAFLMAICCGLLVSGFFLGKMYENREWRNLVPKQMNDLCTECYTEGYYSKERNK